MPAWVDTKEEEKAWKKAKSIVSDQRSKKEHDFTSKDWGLVTHIAKNILRSSVLSSSTDNGLIFKLAKVDRMLRVRASKSDADSKLPADSKEIIDPLKKVMSLGGQSIAALRKADGSGLSEDEVEELSEALSDVAGMLKNLLNGL